MARSLARPSKRVLADFRLGFGEYRNKRLAQVPRDYLAWLLTTKSPDLAADRWASRQFLDAYKDAGRSQSRRKRHRRTERRRHSPQSAKPKGPRRKA